LSSFRLNPADYGPVFAPVLREYPANPLGPGNPLRVFREQIEPVTLERAFAHTTVVDEDGANCCLAGLWLKYDFLDESHTISQDIETPTGSYWHGIMHRREPDYGNAKYWFRRVGNHPVFAPLLLAAQEEAAPLTIPAAMEIKAWHAWDPYRFVDFCQQAATDKEQFQLLCRVIALREWELLFDHSYREATGAL
jgi:hypothetical protein